MSFWKFICCQVDSDEEAQFNASLSVSETKYEKTQLDFHGDDAYNFMLIRKTQKNFFVDYQQRKTKGDNLSPYSVYFSYYEKGVRFQLGEELTLIPEKVLQYIARRINEISHDIVIDAISRSGAASIQIAQECNACNVFGFNYSHAEQKNAIHNEKLIEKRGTCNFLYGTLPYLPLKWSDVLFVNPEFQQRNDQLFSLDKLTPSLSEILYYGLQHSKNIIVILPKDIQLNELASIVSKYYRKLKIDIIKIEVQKIQVDGQTEYFILYLGEIAAISTQDEYIWMTNAILEDSQIQQYYQATNLLLKTISQEISKTELMDIILYSKELANIQSETTLQQFISQCLIKKYTNDTTIKQLYGPLDEDLLFMQETPQINQICSAQTFGNEEIQDEPPIITQSKKKIKNTKKSHISFNRGGVSINNVYDNNNNNNNNNDNNDLLRLLEKQ